VGYTSNKIHNEQNELADLSLLWFIFFCLDALDVKLELHCTVGTGFD